MPADAADAPLYSLLYQALLAQARQSGFEITPEAAGFVVHHALRNIDRLSEAERDAAAQRAVAVLPELARRVSAATAQRRFEDVQAVRAFMQSRACDCPWPWGD
jgi:hypothetical protein